MSDLIRRDDVLLAKFSFPKDNPYKQGWNDAIDAIHDFADKVTDEEELNRLKGAFSCCNGTKNRR